MLFTKESSHIKMTDTDDLPDFFIQLMENFTHARDSVLIASKK